MIIGIDPGQTGAIAALEKGKVVALHDMPVMARTHGKGFQIDPYELSSLIMRIGVASITGVVMEQVNSRPGQGAQATFNFGEGVGVIKGVIGALSLSLRMVTPQQWKKSAGLIRKDKDAARTLAIQMHPEVADQLTQKKDIGRADAIMVARFG